MGKLVVTEFITLDGVIEAPGAVSRLSTAVGPSSSTAAMKATSSSSTN